MNSENKSNLSEEDIKILFGSGPPPPPMPQMPEAKPPPPPKLEFQGFDGGNWVLNLAKIIGIFCVLFVISFTVLNFPALWIKFRYYWQVDKNKQAWGTSQNYPPLATINNHLVIPKIGVDSPVLWNVSAQNTLNALEKGVAHYQNTALPGETGNVFITGHSSYYLWSGGSYKQIFALLDKLEIGDKIYVNYQNKVYGYEVIDKKTVKPEDLSVLNQGNDKTLTLMTCVPVGTNLNRLIVTAKEINL